MTLRAREQDIRREKAASNICTNQALLALAASIYLATIGPHGLRDVAALGAARATELEAALAAVGAPRIHAGPYLNELVVRVPDAPRRPRAGCSTGACSRASRRRRCCPTSRRWPTGCWCARPRSRRPTRSTRFAAALRAELAGAAAGPSWPGGADERRRQRLQPTLFERQPAGPRRRQDPAPARGRARPDPGRRPPRRRRPPCPSSTSPRSSATTSTCRSSTTRSTRASTRSARAR